MMSTLHKLIHAEVIRAVAFVALGFAGLFFFFDMVGELPRVGTAQFKNYQVQHAATYALLLVPGYLYELLPISVLIGSIYVLARMAQDSEYTILRTSGLGPWHALRSLMGLGVVFVLVTFVLGDYVAPWTNRSAQLLRAKYTHEITVGQTGAWLKEKQDYSSFSVNVGAMTGQGQMSNIRIFEFDNHGRMLSSTTAEQARFASNDAWELSGVSRIELQPQENGRTQLTRAELPQLRWPTQLRAEMVSSALLEPSRMKTWDLFQYMSHLSANGQSAQRYEIEFWRKVFYPISCLVMVVLALPFAYLHFRTSGITGYVFGGVMVGISFFLLNEVAGFIGNLRDWTPWVTAAAPGLIYSLISLGAFAWLVLRR